MRKNICLAVALILLLSLVYAQSQELKIARIETNAKSLKEGELFEASVVLEENIEDLNYVWDFGDGSILSGNFPKAYHLFYLDEGIYSKDFNVKVTVFSKDSSDMKSIKVKVSRASSKIKVVYPEPTVLNNKHMPPTISFIVMDYSGNTISTIKKTDVEVHIAGEKVENIFGGEGSFEIALEPSYSFHSVEFIDIKARRGYRDIKATVPIYFEPAELGIPTNPLEGYKFYIGTQLGTIHINIAYPDGSPVETGAFYAELFIDSNLIQKVLLKRGPNAFYADFDYTFSLNDFGKEFTLAIEGQDLFENVLKRKEYRFRLSKDNPIFDLEVLKPNLYKNRILGIRQKLRFEATIDSNQEIKDANVILRIPELGMERQFTREAGLFSLNFIAPSKPAGHVTLELIASGIVGGRMLADIERREVSITNRIDINFIYPQEKETTVFSSENMLKVDLKYPNGALLDIQSLRALLYVDGKPSRIILTKDLNKGYYFFKFVDEFLGQHKLKLVIKDDFFGSKEIECNIVKQMPWSTLLTMLAGVVALGVFLYFIISRIRYMKAEKRRLATRLTQIEQEMKKLQSELFTRRISLEQYKEKMLVLQNEKESIEKELEKGPGFKALFAGITSKLFKRPKAKKEPLKPTPKPEEKPARPLPKAPVKPTFGEQVVVPSWPKPSAAMHMPSQMPKEKVTEVKPLKPLPKPVIKPTGIAKAPPEAKGKAEELSLVLKRAVKVAAGEKPEAHELELYTKEELATINKLCSVLKPAKSKYKPGEIYRALIEEGYKPNVALGVIEKLFNIK
jgi:hypothetical protein